MNIRPKTAVVAAVVIVALAACWFIFRDRGIEIIDQDYVKTNVGKQGFILLDTREARIFNGESAFEGVPGGHIPGAVNFPSSVAESENAAGELAKLGVTKDTTVIVYCNKGLLSTRLAEALVEKFGLSPSKVKNYEGGMMDWASDGKNLILPEDHAPARRPPAGTGNADMK